MPIPKIVSEENMDSIELRTQKTGIATKNGKVDTSVTDVKKGTVDGKSGWWNMVKGKVTRAETVAKNANG